MRHGLLDGSFVASLSAMTGTRDGAIERAENYFDNGGFQSDLQRRVAIPTTSQEEVDRSCVDLGLAPRLLLGLPFDRAGSPMGFARLRLPLLLELLHLPAHQFVKTPALHLRVEHFQSPAVTRLTRAPRPKQPKIERSRQVRIGLAAGGRWIRTLSLCSGLQAFCGFRHPREDQSGLHTGSLLDSRQHGLTASRPREYI